MSERTDNLSFNLVDWQVLGSLREALDGGLEDFLREVKLPDATESDRGVIARLEAGEFPESVEHVFFLRGLRVDRRRYASRLIELYQADPAPTAHVLVELAFVGGSTRMFGDLWLTCPQAIACCADPTFANAFCAFLDDVVPGAPPFVPFDSSEPLMRVLGLPGPSACDPRDSTFDPEAARQLAESLAGLRLDEMSLPSRARFEQYVGWDGETLGPSTTSYATRSTELAASSATRATSQLGVDAHWHPNP